MVLTQTSTEVPAAAFAQAAPGGTPMPAHVTSGVVAYVQALAALITASSCDDDSCASPGRLLPKQSMKLLDCQFAASATGCVKAKDVSSDAISKMHSCAYGIGIDQASKTVSCSESFLDTTNPPKLVASTTGHVKAADKNLFGNGQGAVGESTGMILAQQLYDFVRVHALTPEELGLLYCYTHGGTMSTALSAIGRAGETLEDFLSGRPGFVLKNGRFEAGGTMEMQSMSSVGRSGGLSVIEGEVDDVVDMKQWRLVGARCAAVLGDQDKPASEEVIEAEVDEVVDMQHWRSVGARCASVLGDQDEPVSEDEDSVDVNSQGRVADGISGDLSVIEAELDQSIDVSQWNAVGMRLTAAVNTLMMNGGDEEECVDVNAWGSVAVRLAAAFRNMDDGADNDR